MTPLDAAIDALQTAAYAEGRKDEREEADELAWHQAQRDLSDEWNLDNWPPTDEERGIDWSRE